MLIQALQQLLSFLPLDQDLKLTASFAIGLILLASCTIVINMLFKRYIIKGLHRLCAKISPVHHAAFERYKIFRRIVHLLLLIFFFTTLPLLNTPKPSLVTSLITGLQLLTNAAIILVIVNILSAALSVFNNFYEYSTLGRQRPIKSYLQVIKITLYFFGGIFTIATLLGKSPWVLLTGLGALTAVLILVFRDSILGFVASIQIANYDLVRIGDWIEIPKYGANGDVIDMSLNVIKVQNFDKTIVTVPAYTLLNEGVKNWRGMVEAGGRRIKRSIYIDVSSIKFCNQALLSKFKQIQFLAQYIDAKTKEINQHNQQLQANTAVPVNGRCLTNIGLFRAYLKNYLKNHPKINHNLTFLIRQLQTTEHGLPIEIYIFTNVTEWAAYEEIQADIFDHVFAALRFFDLRAFQNISDSPSLMQPSHRQIPTLELTNQ